jgi:cation:H+ antiporter
LSATGAWWAWAQFAGCAVVIGLAGTRLSREGDVIADKSGLSGNWIGLALLATVTSLPELVTGVASVTIAGVPNIAVGNVLGACVLNLTFLVVLDLLQRGDSVYTRAAIGHVLSAGFGVVLAAFVAFNLALAAVGTAPAIGHVGLYSPILVGLYVLAMRTVFHYERRERARFVEAVADRYPAETLRSALLRFGAAAAAVIAAALWLPFAAKQVAAAMGWHNSFVGTLFVAAATTLPEAVVTLSALRLGALDMAIGNLLGSNLFNLAVLAVDDLFYLRGPLLSHVTPVHGVTAASVLAMSGIVIVGLLDRPNARLLRTVGWVSLFLFTVYLLNSFVIYLHGE